MIRALWGDNVEVIKPTIFPDSTSQVWKLNSNMLKNDIIKIVWNFEEEREIMTLWSFRKLISEYSKNFMSGGHIHLHVPYLPYARQDKAIWNDNTFNLHTFAEMLNAMKFNKVTAVDVHNVGLTTKLINNFENIEVEVLQKVAITQSRADFIIFPDDGARNRYKFFHERKIVFQKTRDQLTGQILKHEPEKPLKVEAGDRFLIIDDICDGGATFISIAEHLKKVQSNIQIGLFVTHGIFSKGRHALTEKGIQLFTTNSLRENTDGFEVSI